MSQQEFLQQREQRNKAESAGATSTTRDENEQSQANLDREPISKDKPSNDTKRDEYIEQILTTDKELGVNQIEGADNVIQQQEQEAATLLSPTILPKMEHDDDTHKYEPPTEEDLRTAAELTKNAIPVTSSAAKSTTPTELQQQATTYMSQPDLDQGTYNAQTLSEKIDNAPKASEDTIDVHTIDTSQSSHSAGDHSAQQQH